MVLQHGDVVVQVGQLAAGVTQESTEKGEKYKYTFWNMFNKGLFK
jgi:hypothetical protein